MSSTAIKTGIIRTIGYEGKSIEFFLKKLQNEGIDLVIDVRANPISRKPGFSKKSLSMQLAVAGISYRHFPELGIPSKYRHQYADYHDLFQFYDSQILPTVPDLAAEVADLCENNTAVLLCFEEKAVECHRSHLSKYLKNNFGLPEQHLYF